MDWTAFDGRNLVKGITALEFNPRAATSFQLRTDHAGAVANVKVESLPTTTSLDDWIVRQRTTKAQHGPWPQSYLTVLALTRGPPNASELDDQAAREQLHDVGCTRQQFLDIKEHLGISASFPRCLLSDQSFYSRHHNVDSTGTKHALCLNLRSSQMTLDDLALTLVSVVGQRYTFAMITGVGRSALVRLESWMEVMKAYGGHPYLSVALFLELHFERLKRRYRQLRVNYLSLWFETFGKENIGMTDNIRERYQGLVESGNKLAEKIDTVRLETAMFGARLPEILRGIDLVPGEYPGLQPLHHNYLLEKGTLLKDHLSRLGRENEYLTQKSSMLSDDIKSLVSSMWSTFAMHDSQINQQIAIAAKRDSSIMMGITVGTLTFLPATAIATIFALPIFNWDASANNQVTGPRFWTYLAVSIPLTVVTLFLLYVWVSVSDRPTTDKQRPRPSIHDQIRRLRTSLKPPKTPHRTNISKSSPPTSSVSPASPSSPPVVTAPPAAVPAPLAGRNTPRPGSIGPPSALSKSASGPNPSPPWP